MSTSAARGTTEDCADYEDHLLGSAYRAMIEHDDFDGPMNKLAELARIRTACESVVVHPSSVAAASGSARGPWASHETALPEDLQPALVLPVVADGIASHVMSFYKKHGPGRFSPTELTHAWRLGALAGLVLTGAARADLCAQLLHQKEGHDDVASRADFEDDVLSALNANDSKAGFFVVRVSDLSSVNQHHGREVGDEVLRLVARALREAVTPLGAVGRIRRNEFAAVLPAADFAAVKALAKQLHSTFDSPLPVLGRDDVSATIGIGIAAASAGSARSVVPLFHAAYGSLDRDLKSRQHKPRASRF